MNFSKSAEPPPNGEHGLALGAAILLWHLTICFKHKVFKTPHWKRKGSNGSFDDSSICSIDSAIAEAGLVAAPNY
jgi:hypothetical protein